MYNTNANMTFKLIFTDNKVSRKQFFKEKKKHTDGFLKKKNNRVVLKSKQEIVVFP